MTKFQLGDKIKAFHLPVVKIITIYDYRYSGYNKAIWVKETILQIAIGKRTDYEHYLLNNFTSYILQDYIIIVVTIKNLHFATK